ncbi:hypothetical protein VNO78_35507 [Psophocarpus tetragonolobus]|uniref:Uncharacterized protein n=1 Tax=Psophocarpus tetragonolobus TaxID=3891 RepID=A0AAN9NM20_PSOTE
MADSTRNAQALKDLEECLSMCIDSWFMELVGLFKQTLIESMQEILMQTLEEEHRNQHTDGNPRVCRARVRKGFWDMDLRLHPLFQQQW